MRTLTSDSAERQASEIDDVIWGVLVDRMIDGILGVHERRAAPQKLIKGTFDDRIGWANRCNLAALPQEILAGIYDRMFNLHLNPLPPFIEESHVHILHNLANDGLGPSIKSWLDDFKTKKLLRQLLKSFKSYDESEGHYVHVGFPLQADDKRDISRCVVYNLATECTACMEFLIEHGIIKITGYDPSGRNWVHAGLASGNVSLLNYLVQNLTASQLLTPRDIQSTDEAHILTALVEFGTPGGFEFVFEKVLKAKPMPQSQLKKILNDEVLETLICWAPVSLADLLYKNGINLANVEAKYLPHRQRTTTTSWHAAAIYNPAGPEMMEWLRKMSMFGPEIRDSQNLTPLMFAAAYDQVETVDWLCKHSNPMLARDPGGFEAWALVRAARSSDPVSDVIFVTILDYLPQRIFTPMGGKYYGSQIADGLVRHKRALKNGTVTEPTQVEAEKTAMQKMRALMSMMPHDWNGCPWQTTLTQYVINRDVIILKHAMGGPVLTASTIRNRRREPKPTPTKESRLVKFALDTHAAYKGLSGPKKRPSVLSSKHDPRNSVIKNPKKKQESASSQRSNPMDPQLWF